MQIPTFNSISKTALLAAGMVVMTSATAQAQESKSFDIKAANEIIVAGDIELEIQIGKKPSLVAYTEDGDFSILEVEQDGDRLSLHAVEDWKDKRRRKDRDHDHDGYRVKLTIPELTDLHARLGGRAEVDNIRGDDLDLRANTGGNIEISGSCDALSIRANTGGNIEADDLKCKAIDAKANTGGYVKVHFAEDHDTSANTGGQVIVVNADHRSSISNITGGQVIFRK